jgi:hypothetical protein
MKAVWPESGGLYFETSTPDSAALHPGYVVREFFKFQIDYGRSDDKTGQ